MYEDMARHHQRPPESHGVWNVYTAIDKPREMEASSPISQNPTKLFLETIILGTKWINNVLYFAVKKGNHRKLIFYVLALLDNK